LVQNNSGNNLDVVRSSNQLVGIFWALCFLIFLTACSKKNIAPPSLKEFWIECNEDSLKWMFENPHENRYISVFCKSKDMKKVGKMRVRGDTSRGFSKKSLKLILENQDGREQTINLNAEYLDKSYLRQHISSTIFNLLEQTCFLTSYARVHLNGRFHGLFLEIENMDKGFLVRNGLDPKGNLYKAAIDGASLTVYDSLDFHWEKKTSKKDSWNDLHQLIYDLDTCSPAGTY
jgi:hypothetical protein